MRRAERNGTLLGLKLLNRSCSIVPTKEITLAAKRIIGDEEQGRQVQIEKKMSGHQDEKKSDDGGEAEAETQDMRGILDSVDSELEDIYERLALIEEKLIDYTEKFGEISVGTIFVRLKYIGQLAKTIELRNLLSDIREYYERYWKSEESTYEGKKSIAKAINTRLRFHDAALKHPENEEPCAIYAVPSNDGKGRYTLEGRKTKKRSGYYQALDETVLCKGLTADVPRKERTTETDEKEQKNKPKSADRKKKPE